MISSGAPNGVFYFLGHNCGNGDVAGSGAQGVCEAVIDVGGGTSISAI